MAEDGRDLAEWLKEVGKRDLAAGRPVSVADESARITSVPSVHPRPQPYPHRHLVAFAGTVAAYLQYYFIGVMSEIYSLKAIVFFIPHGPFG